MADDIYFGQGEYRPWIFDQGRAVHSVCGHFPGKRSGFVSSGSPSSPLCIVIERSFQFTLSFTSYLQLSLVIAIRHTYTLSFYVLYLTEVSTHQAAAPGYTPTTKISNIV